VSNDSWLLREVYRYYEVNRLLYERVNKLVDRYVVSIILIVLPAIVY
jgi:hypothetical protein